MDRRTLVALVEAAIPLLGGLYATLMGFQVVGKKPADDARYAAWYAKIGKQLRWLGPLVMAFGVFLFFVRRR